MAEPSDKPVKTRVSDSVFIYITGSVIAPCVVFLAWAVFQTPQSCTEEVLNPTFNLFYDVFMKEAGLLMMYGAFLLALVFGLLGSHIQIAKRYSLPWVFGAISLSVFIIRVTLGFSLVLLCLN